MTDTLRTPVRRSGGEFLAYVGAGIFLGCLLAVVYLYVAPLPPPKVLFDMPSLGRTQQVLAFVVIGSAGALVALLGIIFTPRPRPRRLLAVALAPGLITALAIVVVAILIMLGLP
jgi:hypothetical protein